jgi:regulator of protease activity HflC (stomatin/prohibitin superfamily)
MGIQELISGIASLAWLAAIGALGFVVFNAARGRRFGGSAAIVVGAVVLAAVLTTGAAGIVFVEPDELGVVVTAVGGGGIRPEPLRSGLHWIVPFAERVERYSILRQNYTMSSVQDEGQTPGDDSIQVRTKDGQQVFIDASVIYSVDPAKVISLYTTWRNDFESGLVRPQARGVIRDVASQYGVEEIVSSKRAEMEALITDELTRIFSSNNMILQDFVLRNIRFSDEYAAAVEQKQIAEQQAQQAKFVVESKKQEAEQARQIAQGQADAAVISAKGAADARVIQAEAEAKALELISAALQDNQDLLTYQYIQKLSPNVQVIYLPSNQPFLLPLPQAGTTTSGSVLPTPTTPVSPTTTTP